MQPLSVPAAPPAPPSPPSPPAPPSPPSTPSTPSTPAPPETSDRPVPPQCPECGDHVEFTEEFGRIVTLVDDGEPLEFKDDPDNPRPPGGWPKCQACLTKDAFAAALADAVDPGIFFDIDNDWLTSDVVGVARGIMDERAFDRMPILADALQDAGCEDEEILKHCRGAGPHSRGCWVLDRLIGT